MTANHPEDLVARATVKAAMLRMGEPIAFGSDAEIIEELSATITSLVGERDALRAALTAAGRAAGAGLSDDVSSEFLSHVPGEIAATIRNRDETIAAQAAAFDSMTDRWVERRKAFEIIGDDQTAALINEFIGDTARALASPHQEGTEPK